MISTISFLFQFSHVIVRSPFRSAHSGVLWPASICTHCVYKIFVSLPEWISPCSPTFHTTCHSLRKVYLSLSPPGHYSFVETACSGVVQQDVTACESLSLRCGFVLLPTRSLFHWCRSSQYASVSPSGGFSSLLCLLPLSPQIKAKRDFCITT